MSNNSVLLLVFFNLDKWSRRCDLKDFLIESSGSHCGQWSGTIYAILVEGSKGQ